MTVRGFLAWYLGTVAMVSASGAVMWHDIQSRKQVETAAIVAPPATPEPNLNLADMPPPSPAAEPVQAAAPKMASHPSQTAALPVPPRRAAPSAAHATRVASSATQSTTRVAKPRQTAKAMPRVSPYQNSRWAEPPDGEPYPGYASGYLPAYPRAVVAPWQMQPYPGYYPYRRYYARYPYYSAY